MSSPKIDMLLSKPIEIPPIAVPINVTATMPMITPSAVRVERVRFERICAPAIFQLSPNSYRKRCIVDLLARRNRLEVRNKPTLVTFDHAITQTNRPSRVRSDVPFMRDQNNCIAAMIQIFEQGHDLPARF